ncbi:MAG: DUF3794 domain-containing protein [Eubacteriales bacterium]|nr:DUF3794 domain-containing protein [Eubacteriales bacterium]
MLEIQKANIQMPIRTGSAAAGALVEGIIKLPEGLEAAQVVGCSARVAELSASPAEDAATVDGTVEFSVLFLTPDGALDSVTGASGFTHRIRAQGMRPQMRTKARAGISSPNARITSPDRIAVDANAELTVQGIASQDCPVVCQAADRDAYFTGVTQYWYECVLSHTAGTVLRDELCLPDACPDAVKILQAQAQARVLQTQVLSGEICLTGEMTLEVLYCSQERPFVRCELQLPFRQSIELAALREDMEVCCSVSVCQLGLELHEDVDGCLRVITVEAPLKITLDAYACRQSPVLEDGWHSSCQLELSTAEVLLQEAPMELITKVTVSQEIEDVALSDSAEGIVALASGAIDGWGVSDGRAEFNGRLKLQLFAAEQGTPVSTWVEVPFDAAADWDALEPGGQLTVTLGTCRAEVWRAAGKWQVQAAADVCLQSLPQTRMDALSEVKVGAPLTDPGTPLVVCVVQKGDTLWSLSKRCRICCDEILACNPGVAESGLQEGMKLIALRKKA